MLERRARPENTKLLIDLFVRDAVIIGDAAARGLTQLIEDFARRRIRKEFFLTQPPRQLAIYPAIGACVAGWVNGFRDVDDPPLQAAGDPFLFLLQTSGEHHVGELRRFREKEVRHGEELEL